MRTRARRLTALLAASAALLAASCSPAAPEVEPRTVTPSPTAERSAPPAPATPSPTPEPEDPLGEGAVNFLLIGSDSRDPADLTGMADTIMVVHVPADREQVYLVSLTRDMWVSIPGLGEGKINSAFSRGGTETLTQTVSNLLGGITIDYVVQSNFAGFIALTRAMDGFEVENKHHSTVTVISTGRVVDFPEGRITLEATDGLIYVRERKRLPLGDLDRTERQRAALVGMMDRIAEIFEEDPATFATLVPMIYQNVKVTGDLDVEDVMALGPMVASLERDDVVGLMVPITGFGSRGGASVNEIDTAQTQALGEALRTSTMADYVSEYGTDYAP